MNEKDCTPDTCPHAALLKRARAACIACTCGGKPAGHGGQVSIEAAGEAIVRSNSAYIDRSPRGQVTKLGQHTEDMAAELFRRWQGLDTIDSLLALHLANGGTCANFGAYLERTHAAIDKLRPERKTFRATAWSKWQGILKRLPLLRGVQSWSKGHGGAKPGQGKGREHKFTDAGREELRQQRKAARQQADETKAQQQAARLAQRIQRQNQHWLEMLQRRGAATAARLAKFERRRVEREAAAARKAADKEAQRIERKAAAKAQREARRIERNTKWLKAEAARLDVQGPTGFRWLAAMVQNKQLTASAACQRLRIYPRKFLKIAELLGICMPHPIIERRRLKAAQAASGVQPSAPAGPTTAPAQPTAAEVSS